MKPLYTFLLGLLFLIVVPGCSNKMVNSNQYSSTTPPFAITLPAGYTHYPDKGNLNAFARRNYKRQITFLEANPEKQTNNILFHTRAMNTTYRIPCTAVGSLIEKVDTVKLKSNGFNNRQANAVKYLQKSAYDKSRKVISSEFIVPLNNQYFYLVAAAPITKSIRWNDEAIIVVQDSLNRQYSAVISSLQLKK